MLSSTLLSVNVGLPRTVIHAGEQVVTGIYKEPVAGPVLAARLGLAGDGQADLSVHGGIHKAVYAYGWSNTLYWRETLGRSDLGHGALGENLTIEDLCEDDIHIGDILRVGNALLQVTQPREPCFKLALRFDMPRLPKIFLKSGRVGCYLKVLEEGTLQAGDAVKVVRPDPAALSVKTLSELRHFDKQNLAGARRALEVEALSPSWRTALQERLVR